MTSLLTVVVLPLLSTERTSKKIATQWEDGCSVLMRFDDGNWYHGVCTKCDMVSSQAILRLLVFSRPILRDCL